MKKQYRRRRGDDSSDSDGKEEGEVGTSAAERPPPNKLARDGNSTSRAVDSRNGSATSSDRRGRDRDKREEPDDDHRRRGAEEKGSSRRYDDSWRADSGRNGRDVDSRWTPGTRDRPRDRDREREREREREQDRARDGRRAVGDRHEQRSERRDVDYSRLQQRRDAALRDGRDVGTTRGRGESAPPSPPSRRRDRDDVGRSGNREVVRGRSRDGARDDRRHDSTGQGGGNSGSKTSRGIFSYIAGSKEGSGGNGSSPTRPPANGDDANGGGQQRQEARPLRPNSAALSAIIRGDRRSNIRMDREQFDGAQTRLRNLAPEGDEVKDKFSTGCRPDLTGRKDHPFQCDSCPMSFPMATQLSDHLQRAHDIFRHPSLITPNKSLSVGLAADVHNP